MRVEKCDRKCHKAIEIVFASRISFESSVDTNTAQYTSRSHNAPNFHGEQSRISLFSKDI